MDEIDRLIFRRRAKRLLGAATILILCLMPMLISGCEKEAARKAVDEHIQHSGNIKSGGTVIAKKVGGSANIELPPKSKLVLLTWKGDSLWVLSRPFREGEKAETYTYQEDSKWGLIEAKIVIRETE